MAPDSQPHVCDVHRIVDGDTETRMCRYCNACKAWICATCWHSPKRLAAFLSDSADKAGKFLGLVRARAL